MMKTVDLILVLSACAWWQTHTAPEYYLADPTAQVVIDILCFQLHQSDPTAHHKLCETEEVPVLLAQMTDRIPYGYEGNCMGRQGPEPCPEPMDVPAIHSYPNWCRDHPDAGLCVWDWTWTCADKSRVLLTSENGKKHCVKF